MGRMVINMDIIKHNSKAWDGEVKAGNIWTKPVTSEIIEDAKKGNGVSTLLQLRKFQGNGLET